MQKHPIDLLTDWIIRDAVRRPEFRQYDFSEVDYLCRRYLRRADLISQAPPELLAAADRHACGILKHRYPRVLRLVVMPYARAAA